MKFRESARSHVLVYRKGELRPTRGLGPPTPGSRNRKRAQGIDLLSSSTQPPPLPWLCRFLRSLCTCLYSTHCGYLPECLTFQPPASLGNI